MPRRTCFRRMETTVMRMFSPIRIVSLTFLVKISMDYWPARYFRAERTG